jgi:metallo-beta-lactamase family protein
VTGAGNFVLLQGSHLVECAGKRILIDCGLYQGSRELDQENAAPFGFDAASIDYVLLTHAHLDHCGRLPLLAKRGLRGEIITTSASRELARLVMLDAAHLLEEDARHRARRGGQGVANGDTTSPLYSTRDALNCLDNFGRTATYSEVLDVTTGVKATFIDAGHILGSASIFFATCGAEPFDRCVVFWRPGKCWSLAAAQPGHPAPRR